MQIQLKQREIEAALKGYISKQGISLVGRTVEITFTAGRKESGISADLVINDMDIPGFSDADEYEAPPVANPVQAAAVAEPVTEKPQKAVPPVVKAAVVDDRPVEVAEPQQSSAAAIFTDPPAEAAPSEVTKPKTGISLFN